MSICKTCGVKYIPGTTDMSGQCNICRVYALNKIKGMDLKDLENARITQLKAENAALRAELEKLRSAQVTHYCENCESVMKENTRLQSVVADLEFENAEITEMTKVMKRDCNELKSALSQYRTAEAEGRILPCKDGTPIFKIIVHLGRKKEIAEGHFSATYDRFNFGKTVFLTRAEAENALKGEGK